MYYFPFLFFNYHYFVIGVFKLSDKSQSEILLYLLRLVTGD